jgi:tetratricopeptide (TPR) repeat protein
MNRNPATIAATAVMLFLVALLAYGPSLKTGFVWDAEYLYTRNPELQNLENLSRVFGSTVLGEDATGERAASLRYYRPLTKAYYIVGYAAFGESPIAYKTVSAILHATVTLLVFLFILSVTSNTFIATFATLLFTVNPIHTEAVVWTYSVSYLLVACFSLGTLLLYRSGKTILALGAFAAALLSHEMAVLVLPVLFIHKWLLEDDNHWRDFLTLAPFLILLTLFLVLRTAVVGSVPVSNADPLTFLNTSAIVIKRYLKMLFWPDAPVTIYLNEEFLDISVELVISYAVCVFLGISAFIFWKRDRKSLFWLLWFGTWVSISLNIGKLGEYLMAEKLIYIASVGILVLLVGAVWLVFADYRRYLAVFLLAIAGIQLFLTWNRISYWHDTATYLEAGLQHSPTFYLGNYALGDYYILRDEFDKAYPYIEASVANRPDFSQGLNSLGGLNYVRGNLHEAIRYWEMAVTQDPSNPMPYFNIGLALRKLGKIEESRLHFDRYLEREPNPPATVVERLKSFGY